MIAKIMRMDWKILGYEPKWKDGMVSWKIPDPFEEFVAKKYANHKGMRYDFFAREWYGICYTCNKELYAPTKKEFTKNRLYHTRNECTGGY